MIGIISFVERNPKDTNVDANKLLNELKCEALPKSNFLWEIA